MTTTYPYAADPAWGLAGFAANLRFEDLPAPLVQVLKRVVLDVVGTTLAGSTLGSGCREFAAVVLEAGGRPEATVLAHGDRIPATAAALVNGALSHALNFDDVFPGGGHLGVVTLPAAFALAERTGGVDGREFLTAVAAGAEVVARLQMAVRSADDGTSEAKPQPTQFLGAFAAAVTCARLLRLDQQGVLSAMGHALMQASGNRQVVAQGAPAKAVYAAFPNQAGVFGALLAQRGLSAECSVLEGVAGLFPTSYANRYVASYLSEGLAERFEMTAVGLKPWPTTGRAHPYIEAGLDIARTPGFDAAAIREVVIAGAPFIRTFCEPIDVRRQPSSPVEAEDSLFYSTAKALCNGAVVLADFQPAGLAQPEVRALGPRMRYEIDPALGTVGLLRVAMADGSTHERRVTEPLGSPNNPLNDDQLLAKFHDCAAHSLTPIPRDRLDRFVDLVWRLDQVDAVSLVRALHP